MKKGDIMEQKITYRLARRDDAAALLEIYAPYVTDTAITFEYEVPSVEEFAGRIDSIGKKYPYIIMEENGIPVGYAYAGDFVGREAYAHSVEMTIYLKKDVRRHGYGKKLYTLMENVLKEMNILNLNACIAYPEVEDEYLTKNSEGFHEHLGYTFVGRFHKCGYKFGRWYDMIWMEKMIGPHEDVPEPVLNVNDIKDILRDKYGIRYV